METIREVQESKREIDNMISEVKDDVERLYEHGEFSQVGLFDLYQKIDDLWCLVDKLAKMKIEEPKSNS